MLRVARANLLIPSTSGIGIELQLPQIERQLILPQYVQFSFEIQFTAYVALGLSHQKDHEGPVATFDIPGDESVWVYDSYEAQSPITTKIDLRGFEFELGGSQAFIGFNGLGTQRQAWCMMWYETKMIGSIADWAAIVASSSYETV